MNCMIEPFLLFTLLICLCDSLCVYVYISIYNGYIDMQLIERLYPPKVHMLKS